MDIEWAGSSEADLDKIFAYYSQVDPTLPITMIARIENALKPLVDFPFLGVEVGYSGLRKWSVKGTSYLVFYDVTVTAVVVHHVRHAASDWQAVFG